jgi:hypothetical protein
MASGLQVADRVRRGKLEGRVRRASTLQDGDVCR